MSEAITSKKLLNLFRDRLRDQGKLKEPADGIIYQHFTDGQFHFMEDLKCTKLPIILVLFEGQDEYPISDNVMKIVDWHFSRDDLNPLFEMPNLSPDVSRIIKLTNPTVTTALGTVTTTDTDVMIRDGDVLTLDVIWRPNDNDVIDSTNNPIIEKRFHRFLVDYALSFYRDFTYIIDGKPVREKNDFKTEAEIDKMVRTKRDQMYDLNGIQLISANFVRF